MVSTRALPDSIAAVLFDLDGVLVDSKVIVERTWRWWALENDLAASDVLDVAHGRPTRDVIELVAPHLDTTEETRRIESREAAESATLEAIPGAPDLVALAMRGRWAVVTSAGRELATTRLATAGLPQPAVLISADDVVSGKPDPEPYERACRALSVPAETCVAIEDAPAGITSARRAGLAVLAVTTTHPASELKHADRVCASLQEIRHLLFEAIRSD